MFSSFVGVVVVLDVISDAVVVVVSIVFVGHLQLPVIISHLILNTCAIPREKKN